jgi:putative flavoprotein involved in K+ transport
VLVVGAGNSGADIALDLAGTHRVLLSGRHPGQLPWHIDRWTARLFTPLVMFAFRHVLTVRTPMGRAMRRRALVHSGPLIRIKSADLAAAGVERTGRTVGVTDGRPALADGRVLDVANVVWCTGFRPDAGWIDLPGLDAGGDPEQRRGAVTGRPGLYFLGRLFQDSLSSSMIRGVGRDAGYIAAEIARRHPDRASSCPAAGGLRRQRTEAASSARSVPDASPVTSTPALPIVVASSCSPRCVRYACQLVAPTGAVPAAVAPGWVASSSRPTGRSPMTTSANRFSPVR